jgi:[NiFe] hydrogenase diaphorase moiety large subunit
MSTELTFKQIEAYAGLKTATAMGRADMLATMQTASMRGRGGAGFPVSVKWNLAAAASGPEKYIVCNADEGEPGTFKDRLILSEYADLVFDGMTIAAVATGAQNGILYLRGEYVYILNELEAVLARRREDGMLGQNISGKDGFDFDIEIRLGSGAYICGEETALIESLEGNRGEPRNRPPFPVDTGYCGCPTVVNNVETLAWAACIFAKGADWFKGIGTEQSAGPKIMSISGDCENPGVYEFPLGVSISELLKTVGAEDTKAVQVGGASGQCVPARDFDRKIAFEDIATGGSIIVFGADRDMLDVARNFMEFFLEESCGQCTPCREGNEKLLEGVEMLAEGTCSMTYLKELGLLGQTMQLTSKCGLGQSSPNAFLSIIEHFSDEILGRTEGASV